MAGSVHKFLVKKTFGVPNWIIGLAGVGGIYVLSQGFPGTNDISFDTKGCPPGNCTLHNGNPPCSGSITPSGGCEG